MHLRGSRRRKVKKIKQSAKKRKRRSETNNEFKYFGLNTPYREHNIFFLVVFRFFRAENIQKYKKIHSLIDIVTNGIPAYTFNIFSSVLLYVSLSFFLIQERIKRFALEQIKVN